MDVIDVLNYFRNESAAKGTNRQPKRPKLYSRPVPARVRIHNRVVDESLDDLAKDLGFGDDL